MYKFKKGDAVKYDGNNPIIPGIVTKVVDGRIHVQWSNGANIVYGGKNSPSLLLMKESTVGLTGMTLAIREAVNMLERKI